MLLLRIIAPLVLLTYYSSAHSQDSEHHDLVVSHSRMNVVYRGIPNPIEIAVPGVACEALKVSVSHGEITGEGCHYTVVPDLKGGPELKFTVSWIKDGEEFNSEYRFRSSHIPDPKPRFGFGSTSDDTLAIPVLLATERLTCGMEQFITNVGCTISEFRLRLFDGEELIFDGRSNSNRTSEEMRMAIRSATPGQRLVVDELVASISDGRKGVPLVPLEFILKR
jgi:hypothetical protein